MCAFRRTALSPSKSCTVVSGVHTVIYGCPHTRAMCGRHFAGGSAALRATPWSAHLLATATGVSGRRVDPACGANHLVIS